MSNHDAAIARGHKVRHLRQTEVRFDEDTFAEIRKFAHGREINFSAAVRLLVEWGLEAEAWGKEVKQQ